MPGNLKIDKDFETRKCTTSIGGGGEGELLPYMGYTNMSAPKEYFSHFDRFWPFQWAQTGYGFCNLFLNWVCLLVELSYFFITLLYPISN